MSIKSRRDERIDEHGFPIVTFKNVGDFSVWTIDLETNAKTKRFYPLDTFEIRNKSSVDLPFTINDGGVADDECLANGSRKIISESPNMRKITVDGSGGVLAAKDIVVAVTRQGMTDDEFRRRQIGRGWFRKLFGLQ